MEYYVKMKDLSRNRPRLRGLRGNLRDLTEGGGIRKIDVGIKEETFQESPKSFLKKRLEKRNGYASVRKKEIATENGKVDNQTVTFPVRTEGDYHEGSLGRVVKTRRTLK